MAGPSNVDGVGHMSPQIVALVGLSGAGKTTVAAHLAARLGWRALDLDADIASRAGCTISDLFEQRGEAEFRRLEAAALKRALMMTQVVLATGGGAPCQPGAMEALLGAASVVWLDAPTSLLATRLAGSEEWPLLEPGRLLASLDAQHHRRLPTYQRAHLRVSVAKKSIPEVASHITEALKVRHG